MSTNPKEVQHPAFGGLVDECAARGVSRTVAFELAQAGLIETFKIGRRRYVILKSLDSLPDRLSDHANAERVAA